MIMIFYLSFQKECFNWCISEAKLFGKLSPSVYKLFKVTKRSEAVYLVHKFKIYH